MLLLILDVPEPENLLQLKKIVSHVYVKKSKKEDGTGFNVHETRKIGRFFVLFFFKQKYFFF